MRFKKTIPVIMLITSFMMVLSSAFSISAATIDTEINEVGASVSDNSSVGADTRKTHKYTANDITIVQKIILGQSVNLSQKNIIELYDIDDNKKITKADQELIQEHLNGKININTGDFTPQVPTTPIYEQTSVSLPVSSVTIGLNETFTIKPKAQSGALFSYISGNQQVASVNSSGLITPKKVGTANITVTARIAKKRSFSVGANIDDTEENESSVGASNSATFTVTVKKEAKALTLNKTALTLGIGEVFTLRGSVSSDSAAYGRAYKSSNAKIAEVDKNTGKVTAKSTGTATISCTLKNNVTAQCKVSVKQQAGTVSLNSSRVELKPGQQYDFVSSIPGGTAAYWRKYYSENTGIVTINEQTGKATAKSAGTTRIYCVLSNGCKAYSTVIVKSATQPTTAKPTLSLDKSSLTVTVGQTATLKATTNQKSVTFTSSNTSIATVTSQGVVKGVKAGTATITCKAGNLTKTCTVTVKASTQPTTAKPTLNLDKTTLTVTVGKTATLKATTNQKSVTYTSSNTGIATVTNQGVVKGVKAGTATITCKAGGLSRTCTVTVKAATQPTTAKPTLSLDKSSLSVTVGKTATLKATTNQKSVTYTSSNTGIATVTNQGVVKGVKAGTATITCKAGGLSRTCTVTVKAATQPTTAKPTLSLDKSSLSVTVGKTATLKATTNQKSVTYTSSNTGIATVTNQGVVKGVKAGTATITCKAGNLTKTCTVTVKAATQPTTAKPTLSLDKSSLSVTVGKTATLKATTNQKSVTYTSSNTSIATVTSQGVVKGVKAGTATITCKAGGLSRTCTVTVKATTQPTTAKPNATKPTKITVSPLNTTVFVNEAVTITASTNASGSHFTFTSSDPSVATVDANGKVTGKKYGFATINVKCKENTSLTRACMIKVRNKTSVTPTGTASNASKPTKVTVSPLNQTVYIGESFIISASTNVKGSSFTFTSTDASVAKVDSNGKVSGLKAGSVTISVKCKENPSLSRACMVRVKSKPVAVITLSDESLLMGVGESYTITVKANGEKTSNASFKSTNTNVATVDKNGKITAKSKGTTKIEVTRSDGGKATCSVEVKPFAGSLTLNKSSIEMSVGDQFDFNSSAPKGTAALWRLFYSENPKVVEIRERGGLATAKSEGKTRIYCELYTGKRVYATVTVVNRPTSVKFNRTTATVSAGRDLTLKASYNITAARSDKWKSSNEKVIKFVYADASGNSTWNAVSEGTATITVTSYGNLTSTCKVTVTKKVESGNDDDTSIPADEMTLRKKVCDIMNSWVGAKQGDSTHAEIIRIYNNYCTSAPIGTYDAWCAATVSAAWIKAGIAEYTGAHCNCGGLESFAMQHGIWVEDDGYKPKIGDAIIYYWGDNGVGDVTYYADHVGLVTAVNGNKFTVTEGNTGNSECATREVTVNGRYIRGFITPKYGDIVKKLNK